MERTASSQVKFNDQLCGQRWTDFHSVLYVPVSFDSSAASPSSVSDIGCTFIVVVVVVSGRRRHSAVSNRSRRLLLLLSIDAVLTHAGLKTFSASGAGRRLQIDIQLSVMVLAGIGRLIFTDPTTRQPTSTPCSRVISK